MLLDRPAIRDAQLAHKHAAVELVDVLLGESLLPAEVRRPQTRLPGEARAAKVGAGVALTHVFPTLGAGTLVAGLIIDIAKDVLEPDPSPPNTLDRAELPSETGIAISP